MRFSDFNLDPRLLSAVEEAQYTVPTSIQAQAIIPCMEGQDLIGTAATGTGKTAAFVLPLLHRLLKSGARFRAPRVLIVTPTRELAEQIREVVSTLGRRTHIRSGVVYGGVGFEPQRRALSDGTEIIVCCPGRLLDLMGQGHVNLKHIEAVVLDEADRMLDMGFLPDIKRILGALPRERQTLLFSATFAPELMDLIRHYLVSPKRVSVDIEAPAETVDHCFYPVHPKLKTLLLLELLKTMEHRSILVFTRTKHRANRVMAQLAAAGYKTGVLHSNKSQNQRKFALDGFRAGTIEILVATDIAARGLDIESISHVINYDIPDTATNYIHRIGRTGRAERSGDALTFISQEDAAEVRDIERRLGAAVEKKTLQGFNYHQPIPSDKPPVRHGHPGHRPPHRQGQHQGQGRRQDHGHGKHRDRNGARPYSQAAHHIHARDEHQGHNPYRKPHAEHGRTPAQEHGRNPGHKSAPMPGREHPHGGWGRQKNTRHR
jgi:ATP-dependent RNA helicase RhlE